MWTYDDKQITQLPIKSATINSDMKRELLIHLSFWFSFFVFITLIRGHFNLSYYPFWIGGLVGVILPDIDHIIYAFFIKPTDLTSQRIGYLLNKKEIKRSVELLYETRNERIGLIFHSIFFQIIFLILTFWMMSSSGSIFGKGLVLSFALHLAIDQIMDITDLNSFDNWLRFSSAMNEQAMLIKNYPFSMDLSQSKIYWLSTTVVLCLFGLLL